MAVRLAQSCTFCGFQHPGGVALLALLRQWRHGAAEWRRDATRAIRHFLHHTRLGRCVVGYARAHRFSDGFKPPPPLLAPLIEEFVKPVLFGRGYEAVVRSAAAPLN